MREYISPNVDVFEGQLSIIVAGGKLIAAVDSTYKSHKFFVQIFCQIQFTAGTN